MNQQELINATNELYTKSIELLNAARKNLTFAKNVLEKSAETFKLIKKYLSSDQQKEWKAEFIVPLQKQITDSENKIQEYRELVDTYRNLLEAAEISVDEYIKLSDLWKGK